jgi:hypothetical protein
MFFLVLVEIVHGHEKARRHWSPAGLVYCLISLADYFRPRQLAGMGFHDDGGERAGGDSASF